MNEPRILRIGLVGAGWVTQHHLAAWAGEAARAKVVAIADPAIDRARERAAAFGIEGVYADAAEMLERERLDAVDIASPRETHAEAVRLAARHGVAALCQKPLAPTFEEARALVEEVAAMPRPIRLMVHENWRFRPCYRQLGAWLREGRIGRVTQAQMTLLSSGLVPDASGALPALVRQPFVATLQRALVMEILIHHIDTLRFLLSEMRLVHSQLGRQSAAMRGEDRAALTFTAEGQATVTLLANLGVAGEPPALVDRLVVIGEAGTIRLDGDSLVCCGAQPESLRYDLPQSYLASYAGTIGHFLDRLADGLPFETSPADNLRTLRIVEDVYAAATSTAS